VLQRLDRAYFALFREYPALLRLGIVTGAGQIAFALLNVYALPIYLVEGLHVSGVTLGAVSATFLVCEMVLKFPMGRLSDRFGRKPFLVLGPLLICLNPTIMVHLPRRLWALIFPLRAADGAGAAALWPPLFAMVGDLVNKRSRAAAMSVLNTIYVGAIGLAVLLGSFAEYFSRGYHLPFYLASLFLFLSGLVGYFGLPRSVLIENQSPGGNSTDAPERVTAASKQERPGRATYPMAFILLISLLMTLGVLMLANFIVLYIKLELGLSALHLGILLIALAAPVLLLGLPLGHAADKWGKSRAVRLSLVASALVMWLIPSCRTVPLFALVGVILVTSHILGIPAWLAVVSELAPTSRRGGIMGIVSTAEGAGAALGPLLGGWLWDLNHAHIFYGSAVLLTLGAIVACVILREDKEYSGAH